MENSSISKPDDHSGVVDYKAMAKFVFVTSVTVLLGAAFFAYAYHGDEEVYRKMAAAYSVFHRASDVAAAVVAVGLVLGAVLILAGIFVSFLVILSVLEVIFRPQVAILGVRPRFARIFFGSLGGKQDGLR